MSQYDQASSRAVSREQSRDPSREGSPVQTPREQRHIDRQRSKDATDSSRDAGGVSDRPGAADEGLEDRTRRGERGERERGAGAGLDSEPERFSIGTASDSESSAEDGKSYGKQESGQDGKGPHSHAGYEPNVHGATEQSDRTTEATIWKKAEKMEKELHKLRALRTQFEEQRARRARREDKERDERLNVKDEPPATGAQRGGEGTGEREERLLGIVEKLCGKLSDDRKDTNSSSKAGAQRVNRNPPKFSSLVPGSTVHALTEWLTVLRTYVRGTWPRNGPSMLQKVMDVCFEFHGNWVDADPDDREQWIPTFERVELGGDEVDAHGLMCSDIASRLPTAIQAWAESRATERGDAPTLVDYMFRTLCVSLPSSFKAGDKVRETMEGTVKDSEKPNRDGLATWLRAWKAQLTRLELMDVYTNEDNYSKLLTHIASVTDAGQSEEFRHGLLGWKERYRIPVKRVNREYCARYYHKVLSLADNCYADLEPKAKKEAHLTEKEKKKKKAQREVHATEKGESQKLADEVARLNTELVKVKETHATEFKGGAKGGGPRGPGPGGNAGKKRDPLPCKYGKECTRGGDCKFSHDPKVIAEYKKLPCKGWKTSGRCSWGKMCVFMHAQALMVDVNETETCSSTEVHLAQKLDESMWGIYDVAAQETVVGEPHLVASEHGDATVKTIAGTTKGKHVDAITPFGTATNATYVQGARNLLAHQTVTRLGMVGFSWFNGRAPPNVRTDGPALYGKEGEIIPLQEQDGFALIPKYPEAEVHHASGVREEVGERMPCWRCGGRDHWAAACISPSDGGERHEEQGEAGIWHWTSMPERSRRILWKALCKAGYATDRGVSGKVLGELDCGASATIGRVEDGN